MEYFDNMCSKKSTTKKEITEKDFEFLKLDYEQGTLSARQCHDQKLAYQRFYIAMVSAILAIIIYINRLFLTEESMKSDCENVINQDSLIGLPFIFAAIIGAIVVKNLAQIRVNTVFYSNAVINIRKLFIKTLNLSSYPDIDLSDSADRKSSDYIAILLFNIVNSFLFVFGVFIILKEFNIIQTIAFILAAFILCISFHFYWIEKALSAGISFNGNRRP